MCTYLKSSARARICSWEERHLTSESLLIPPRQIPSPHRARGSAVPLWGCFGAAAPQRELAESRQYDARRTGGCPRILPRSTTKPSRAAREVGASEEQPSCPRNGSRGDLMTHCCRGLRVQAAAADVNQPFPKRAEAARLYPARTSVLQCKPPGLARRLLLASLSQMAGLPSITHGLIKRGCISRSKWL